MSKSEQTLVIRRAKAGRLEIPGHGNESGFAPMPPLSQLQIPSADMDALLRLAERGLLVEGATEAWIVVAVNPPDHWRDIGHVYKDKETAEAERSDGGFNHWRVRRVLILAEDE